MIQTYICPGCKFDIKSLEHWKSRTSSDSCIPSRHEGKKSTFTSNEIKNRNMWHCRGLLRRRGNFAQLRQKIPRHYVNLIESFLFFLFVSVFCFICLQENSSIICKVDWFFLICLCSSYICLPGWKNLAAFRRGKKWPWKFSSSKYLKFLWQMRRVCA